ncbi:hypothetical protein ACO34A_20375 [Rhizobium sp. ACO-34A]|nr:hypothetical protein ACO34A_20375 [Rhizobium sp. ACO-34A]
MPEGIYLLHGRSQPAIQTRSGSLERVGPANRVEPDPVAAAIGRIFPGPCCKSRFFVVRLIGTAATLSPTVSGSRRTSAAILLFCLACGSVPSLTASFPSASSLLRHLSPPPPAVPSCGSHHRPSTSHRRFSNAPERHLFAPPVMLRRHANAAPAMKRGFFRPLRLDHPRAALSPRTFRLAFPQEEGRTPHSRQQVIERIWPSALRGIPLRAGWHEH